MTTQTVPELLGYTLKTHFNVNAMGSDWLEGLQSFLNHPRFPGRAEQFKQELTEAILLHTVTPESLERITGISYDEQEEVESFLRETWQDLYGDELVTLNNIQETQETVAR